MKCVNQKFDKINYIVNPYIECLGVIFVLSDFSLNNIRTNGKYVQEVKTFFNEYKDNDFINKFKNMLNNPYFKYDAPVELALTISAKKKPTSELLQRANLTYKTYKVLLKEFEDFMNYSNFYLFFNNHKEYYVNSIKQFIKDLKLYSPQNYLFDFIGLSSIRLNVVLMFGVSTSNYGIRVGNKLFCCVRPYKQSKYKGEIDFCYNLPYTTTLILHEFAHSFINNITKKYLNKIENMNEKCFKLAFEKNPYGESRETVINETIIRTIECEYLKKYFPNDYITIKDDYMQNGFICIPNIENVFEIYLSNRKQYKNILSIYPMLIDAFDRLKI